MDNKPKTQEEQDDINFPATTFKKLTFNFSKQELLELQPLEDATRLVQTFLALGQIAQKAKDTYVGGQVLDRLGVKKSIDSKFNYDLENNRIIVYEPRLWCSVCNNRRAEFKIRDKICCQECAEKVKQQLTKPLEEKEAKEIKKKKV